MGKIKALYRFICLHELINIPGLLSLQTQKPLSEGRHTHTMVYMSHRQTGFYKKLTLEVFFEPPLVRPMLILGRG